MSRAPSSPSSVSGERPAVNRIGTLLARRVQDAAQRVGGADADMHHDRRHPARGGGIAVRHRHREILVRRDQRLRHGHAGMRRLRVGLDDRREIGAGIGEQVLDAAIGEQREIGLRDALDRHLLAGHGFRLSDRRAARCNRPYQPPENSTDYLYPALPAIPGSSPIQR